MIKTLPRHVFRDVLKCVKSELECQHKAKLKFTPKINLPVRFKNQRYTKLYNVIQIADSRNRNKYLNDYEYFEECMN